MSAPVVSDTEVEALAAGDAAAAPAPAAGKKRTPPLTVPKKLELILDARLVIPVSAHTNLTDEVVDAAAQTDIPAAAIAEYVGYGVDPSSGRVIVFVHDTAGKRIRLANFSKVWNKPGGVAWTTAAQTLIQRHGAEEFKANGVRWDKMMDEPGMYKMITVDGKRIKIPAAPSDVILGSLPRRSRAPPAVPHAAPPAEPPAAPVAKPRAKPRAKAKSQASGTPSVETAVPPAVTPAPAAPPPVERPPVEGSAPSAAEVWLTQMTPALWADALRPPPEAPASCKRPLTNGAAPPAKTQRSVGSLLVEIAGTHPPAAPAADFAAALRTHVLGQDNAFAGWPAALREAFPTAVIRAHSVLAACHTAIAAAAAAASMDDEDDEDDSEALASVLARAAGAGLAAAAQKAEQVAAFEQRAADPTALARWVAEHNLGGLLRYIADGTKA